MNKKLFVIFVISLFYIGCTPNDIEIHLEKNIYLMHNGDDVNSGYVISQKIDNNISASLIDENVIEVYYNSTNIFVKSTYAKQFTYFYIIQLQNDSSKRPVIIALKEHKYIELTTNCVLCKKIKLKHDTLLNKWILNN